MRVSLCFLMLLFLLGNACTNKAAQIPQEEFQSQSLNEFEISTFNIKWFGIGGTLYNQPEHEYRHDYLKQFIKQELSTSEVIVFTEVVRVDDLKNVLVGMMDCVTYERTSSKHQRVVICFDDQKYRVEKFDNDFEIPEVALGSRGQRPGAHAKICHKQGDCFLQIVGVHLAAGFKSQKRYEQIQALSDELDTQTQTMPTVILGDFNSYRKEQNKLDKDDIERMEEILNESSYTFSSITKGLPTYNNREFSREYDHIVISNDIQVLSSEAYMACQFEPDINMEFIPYYSFRKYISDHCPVTARLRING